MVYHSKKHLFNYLETEFRPDGSRVHKCQTKGCDVIAVLPPLFFDKNGRRTSERAKPKFFEPTGLFTEFSLPSEFSLPLIGNL